MLKPGFYRSLSGKRAAVLYIDLVDTDARHGTHRAMRFAMRFESHGNATSVECFHAAVEGQGYDAVGSRATQGTRGNAGTNHSLNRSVVVNQSFSVIIGQISHVHASPSAIRHARAHASSRRMWTKAVDWARHVVKGKAHAPEATLITG